MEYGPGMPFTNLTAPGRRRTSTEDVFRSWNALSIPVPDVSVGLKTEQAWWQDVALVYLGRPAVAASPV